MPDAAYYRRWRAEHPEYAERQRRLRNERRRKQGRESRAAEYANRRSRAIPPIPPMHTGHALFDKAREIVGPRRGSLISLYDPLYDDLLSEATLALIDNRDPIEAVKTYRSRELAFGRVTIDISGVVDSGQT